MKHLNSCTYTPSMTLCIILEFSLAFLERESAAVVTFTFTSSMLDPRSSGKGIPFTSCLAESK